MLKVKEQNLTEGNILKSLILFAFPVLMALFLQAMYGAADLIIVGQFAGTYQQSGVATGSQLFNLVTMVITGLTMGVTVFVGRCIGAGNPKRPAGELAPALRFLRWWRWLSLPLPSPSAVCWPGLCTRRPKHLAGQAPI